MTMNDTASDLRYIERPARSLEDFEATFDPTLAVDPESRFYVPRTDVRLRRMVRRLRQGADRPQHLFLCGHRGSGKTTELLNLQQKDELQESYVTVFLTIQQFGAEIVDLTHDALMLEIGLRLAERADGEGVAHDFRNELDDWGRQVVKTFLHDEEALAEAGAGATAWLAYFKAQLRTRREWKTEQRQILEPKVDDLVGILNRIAAALREKTGKQVLVIVDDLEKGESDADRAMHRRLFQDNYDTLTRPRFSLVYVTPIYFRSLPGSRIPQDQLSPSSNTTTTTSGWTCAIR